MARQPSVGGAGAATPGASEGAGPAPMPTQQVAVVAEPESRAALVAEPAPAPAQQAAVIAVPVAPAAPTAGPTQLAAVTAPPVLVTAPVPAVGQVDSLVANPAILNLAGALVGVQARDDTQAGVMGPQATKSDIRFTIWPKLGN